MMTLCRKIPFQIKPNRLALMGLLFGLMLTGAAVACQVPVFRYALERWSPDRYQVWVLFAGELDSVSSDAIVPLTGELPGGGKAIFKSIDVTQASDNFVKALWKKYADGKEPVMLALYPSSYSGAEDQVAHRCDVSEANVQQILNSPKRQEIADRLTDGESAVWILLESGEAAKDQAALKSLQEQNARDAVSLALPSPEELEIKPEILDKAKIKLRIGFSVISLRRDDPRETFLIDCLLNSEADLRSFDEPIAFPVFGRGRVLYALVGKGISADTIRAASSFIVGPCSCQVKEQNPGFDLLLNYDWDSAVGDTYISSPLPGATSEPKLLTIPSGRSPR